MAAVCRFMRARLPEIHFCPAAKVAVHEARLDVRALAALRFRVPGAIRLGTPFVNEDGD